MENFNFIYSSSKEEKPYEMMYSMFATDYEIKTLAKRIYASKNMYSHKLSLIKKCGEAS